MKVFACFTGTLALDEVDAYGNERVFRVYGTMRRRMSESTLVGCFLTRAVLELSAKLDRKNGWEFRFFKRIEMKV